MLLRALPLLGLLLCPACDSDPRDDCEPPSGAEGFEIGTGEICFERVKDGQAVSKMSGPQGGYHLWLALGCTDCGVDARVDYRLLDPATGELLANTAGLTSVIAEFYGEEWPQSSGLQVGLPGGGFIDDPSEPDLDIPEGTPFRLEVTVRTKDGGTVLHQGTRDLVMGKTVNWNPCEADDSCGDDGSFAN